MTYGSTTYGATVYGEETSAGGGGTGPATATDTDWSIDGDAAPAVGGVSLTPDRLSLSFDADRDTIAHWRGYDRVGDFRVATAYGGGFRALDTGGQSLVSVDPPDDRQPPFDGPRDYWVASYDEQQAAPDRYRITLTLQRPSERAGVYAAPNQSGGDWTLALSSATLALDAAQVQPMERTGTTATVDLSLSLLLDDVQAAAIADDCGTPAVVTERGVPDAAGVVVDASASDTQTVTITAPAGATLADGDYGVAGWTLEHRGYGPRRWRVQLDLRAIS